MSQLQLPMLTYYTGPQLVSADTLSQCTTFRDAVRMCWMLRTRKAMTRRQLAEESGSYASHITDFLDSDTSKRDLPARHISAFESACGNRCISQWLAAQANLTILEQFIQQRAA